MRNAIALSLVILFGSTAAAQTKTLSDLAAERRAGVRGVVGGTFSVSGASGMPVLLAPVYGEGGSFEEVDRSDAAHRPAPATFAPVMFDVSPDWTRYFPYGYGGMRTHFRAPHASRPAPSVARPSAPAPAPVSQNTTSGLTNDGSRSSRRIK